MVAHGFALKQAPARGVYRAILAGSIFDAMRAGRSQHFMDTNPVVQHDGGSFPVLNKTVPSMQTATSMKGLAIAVSFEKPSHVKVLFRTT